MRRMEEGIRRDDRAKGSVQHQRAKGRGNIQLILTIVNLFELLPQVSIPHIDCTSLDRFFGEGHDVVGVDTFERA